MTITTRTVLVLDPGDGHGRSALAAVRALDAGGYRPVVATWGRASLAAASRSSVRTALLPPPDDPGFADAVDRTALGSGSLTVFPSSDAALRVLGPAGSELVDKVKLAERAAAAGFPTPPTTRFENGTALLDAADTLPFPIVVKPAFPTRPARRHASASSLGDLADANEPLLVQPYVTDPMRAVGGVIHRGRLVAASHQRNVRTWPAECGTSSAAETIEPDPSLESSLVALLDGFEGVFQAQLAGRYLLDLNPRVYGSLPLAVAAGANIPAVWCDLLRGEDVPEHRARPGVRYRWIEGDLRSLRASLRAGRISLGEAAWALRPRRGTAHSTESLGDPRPTLARVRYAARRGRPAR
jgi:predicted ATP-grasp superfamily ATP-dependent carboligase